MTNSVTRPASVVVNAFNVAIIHSIAMVVAGGDISILVCLWLWLGVRFVSKSWLNLDLPWAVSLFIVGLAGMVTTS